MKKQHHQFFLLNHGNLNMDGFFLEWNLIFPETWLLGSMLNFRGASRRGRFIWTFNSYTPATFFFESPWNGIRAKLPNPIRAKLHKHDICCRVFPTTRARILGCYLVVFVCLGNLIAADWGHWYRNIPAELAMHFPQAMEILEGDGSDASVSTITMSKVPWASSDVFFLTEENQGAKKRENFFGLSSGRMWLHFQGIS